MTDFLKNLKVGDKVIVVGRNIGSISTIVRETKTLFIVDKSKMRFRKSDGVLVGNNGWDVYYLEEATPYRINKIEEKKYRCKLLTKIYNFRFDKLSTDNLEYIYKLINKGGLK